MESTLVKLLDISSEIVVKCVTSQASISNSILNYKYILNTLVLSSLHNTIIMEFLQKK